MTLVQGSCHNHARSVLHDNPHLHTGLQEVFTDFAQVSGSLFLAEGLCSTKYYLFTSVILLDKS